MSVSRRAVLGGTGATLGALVGLDAWGAAPASAAETPTVGGGATLGREVDLRSGWRHILVNTTGEDAPLPDPGDASWHTVDVPHDWSISQDPRQDEHTTSGTGFLPGGLGWYTKSFVLPSSVAGKRLSVEFDGVYMDSEVHFNGELVGRHPYGYTGFRLDLTEQAHTDGRTVNTLAVKARNQIPSSRWYSGSGIYRDVRLVVTDPVHLTRHGVTVTTPGLAEAFRAGRGDCRVVVTAVSEERSTAAEISAYVRDPDGRVVAHRTVRAGLGGDPTDTTLDLSVTDPQLWSVDRPRLYTVLTRISRGGRVLDETTTRFGFRWFAFDPDHGFSLNGESLKLQGVNLHHDLGALGSAYHADAARRQLTLMKKMGVNALRTSHNPPAPQTIGLCEELGVVMMVEAFDCWRTSKTPYDYGRFFDEHSDADLREMVHGAKNSPAVVMWSVGNEIPDSTSEVGVPIAERLVRTVKEIDPTRPVVMGSDKYRTVPADGSPQDRILRMLDGVGVNYNDAASVDGLHAKYPDKFFFESESASSTSTRNVYDSPEQLNTGENHTPGRRGASSYDNNLASWTTSGEYGLKKDRDRRFFAGQFVWTGIDYIGEPTPFDVYPVKASFFGATDTAGFPKDQYSLYRSQWSAEPMVHLVPMDWTTHRAKEEVTVWAYSNVEEVELLLNGKSLGVRRFDRKKTVDGRSYLETTEATGDDKTVTSGPYPGSYTSPNGSAGHLHLTWKVPFSPGRLVAVARRDGVEVARDVLRTAGPPAAVRLAADRREVTADGRSLVFVTAEVTDARGVVVPDAGHALTFHVTGGALLGADNGAQESAENYRSPTRSAFHGKALAIVRADVDAHSLTVTATAHGLASGATRVGVVRSRTATPAPAPLTAPAGRADGAPAPSGDVRADASYSGAADTVPDRMLDADPATAWSNHYVKAATGLLPAVSRAHAEEWVSLTWPAECELTALTAAFTDDDTHARPAALVVEYRKGGEYLPVDGARVSWADASEEPTRITFEPVRTDRVRLRMTSAHPHTAKGFLRVVRLAPATREE
ncbi:glycoside hydrolase family 2 TIM barrel-domain containing protein [Streptomyces sp. NPDC059740]|uniref:glycoside hydrolase family 2 TIM barrel-domain containing protein n=1 Tax=Streptomyces sp. NPDC059740 TaxID=3346926 RepID=UPI003655359F